MLEKNDIKALVPEGKAFGHAVHAEKTARRLEEIQRRLKAKLRFARKPVQQGARASSELKHFVRRTSRDLLGPIAVALLAFVGIGRMRSVSVPEGKLSFKLGA